MNIKHLAALVMLSISLASKACAQKNFWNSKNAYLGQPRPSDTAQVFAPGLLRAPGTIVMGRVSITPDGKEIYYDQEKQWYAIDTAKIKVFRFDGHKWNGPTVVFEKFGDQALSPDGKAMYFSDDHHLWMSKRTQDGWSAPAIVLEDQHYLYDPMPTKSGVFYLASEADEEDKKFGITSSFSTLIISYGHASIKSLLRP